ncbi:MAG: HAMP domain-containing histidine kinase [Bacteriovoracaceae bacterium]|nr:HAMP domain-containing histidine kinase [Bacteriovoracaceae bacterium]
MGLCSIEEVHINDLPTSLNSNQIENIVEKFAQVAHDIKSPLAVLDTLLTSSKKFPESERTLVLHAVGRIKSISKDVLVKRQGIIESNEKLEFYKVFQLISPIIQEKLLETKGKNGIVLNGNDFLTDDSPSIKVKPTEFKRMISNIINNAIESLSGHGFVDIDIHQMGNHLLISVIDNGKGIPLNVLKRLGHEKISYAKTNGNGIGIYSAAEIVKRYNGVLEITSTPGKGTRVDIKLPGFKVSQEF